MCVLAKEWNLRDFFTQMLCVRDVWVCMFVCEVTYVLVSAGVGMCVHIFLVHWVCMRVHVSCTLLLMHVLVCFVGHFVFSLLVTCCLLYEHVWEVDVCVLFRAHVSWLFACVCVFCALLCVDNLIVSLADLSLVVVFLGACLACWFRMCVCTECEMNQCLCVCVLAKESMHVLVQTVRDVQDFVVWVTLRGEEDGWLVCGVCALSISFCELWRGDKREGFRGQSIKRAWGVMKEGDGSASSWKMCTLCNTCGFVFSCVPPCVCVCVCVCVFVCVHFVGHYVFSLLVTCYLLFEHVWEVDVRALLRAHVSWGVCSPIEDVEKFKRTKRTKRSKQKKLEPHWYRKTAGLLSSKKLISCTLLKWSAASAI